MCLPLFKEEGRVQIRGRASDVANGSPPEIASLFKEKRKNRRFLSARQISTRRGMEFFRFLRCVLQKLTLGGVFVYYGSKCWCGGTGRRVGLKNPWSFAPYRFDPDHQHLIIVCPRSTFSFTKKLNIVDDIEERGGRNDV